MYQAAGLERQGDFVKFFTSSSLPAEHQGGLTEIQ
jgi:hypothetical protein